MLKKWTKIILISTFIMIPACHFSVLQSYAATYYVDAASGRDSNNGRSEGSAWRSLSKVDAFNFSAGDVIKFRRGQT